jgi:hypothetical protein
VLSFLTVNVSAAIFVYLDDVTGAPAELATAKKMLEEEKELVEKLHEKVLEKLDVGEDKKYGIDYRIDSTNEGKYENYIKGLLTDDEKKSSIQEEKKAAEDKINLYKEVYNKAITLTEKQYSKTNRKNMAAAIATNEKRYENKSYSWINKEVDAHKDAYNKTIKAVTEHYVEVKSKKELEEEKKKLEEEQKKKDEENAAEEKKLAEEQKKLAEEQSRIDREKNQLEKKKKETIIVNRIVNKQKIDDVYGIDTFEIPSDYTVENYVQGNTPKGYNLFLNNDEYKLIREYNTKKKSITLFVVKKVHNNAKDGFPEKVKTSNKKALDSIKKGEDFKMASGAVGSDSIFNGNKI